ncbi:MAG: hypothetical protein RRB13_10295 [bacterium]|nr:hypothetical protein [bacterium]
MPKSLVFLMDPFASLNLETETSLLFMEELLRRGHRVFWAEARGLCLDNGKLLGQVAPVQSVKPFELGESVSTPLDGFDALINRKDPPFDLHYLHVTLLLDFLAPQVVQINAPRALRDLNEKLVSQRFPERTTDCRVAAEAESLAEFVRQAGRAVVKPLDDCSGRGIGLLEGSDPDLLSKLQDRLNASGGFLMVQRYLPEVHLGDKRVYLAGGRICGLVNRIPKDEHSLGNIHMGARCVSAQLSPREAETVEMIIPLLQAEGVFLAGVDFIGGELTEINLTSPSALRQINEVDGKHWEVEVVDGILDFIKLKKLPATSC